MRRNAVTRETAMRSSHEQRKSSDLESPRYSMGSDK